MITARLVLGGDGQARLYLSGNTFNVKEMIKVRGGQWDTSRSAWWLDGVKWKPDAPLTLAFIDSLNAELKEREDSRREKVLGRAVYNDKRYDILWACKTRSNEFMAKLRDGGNKTFWAPYTTDLRYAAERKDLAFIDPLTPGILTTNSARPKLASEILSAEPVDDAGAARDRRGPGIPRVAQDDPDIVVYGPESRKPPRRPPQTPRTARPAPPKPARVPPPPPPPPEKPKRKIRI